ncbi:halocyanin [Natrialba magadii ATCC 43099]|uniref:Halocyanin n=1 Tax=Natrialba magadii (strain ATCC 43099 / DSM 3394 / CCM 3739 / CIP 104546 / IAM 13178 / JCM 8861 / NBRC 102185 / NCIMB 2190 / MS3) TaxID=547559 RepID=D3SYG4_NATMM|nr:plastocyanin/azurin family copper-binding protein [Natrialba magadii]ADD06135.1 halocyanin [Natrialba magadii ATCC 43099]ELY30866.1 halocyanin domain-containing protein [Natrialba magadii ATCC 43099]
MRQLDRRTALKGIGITTSLVGFGGVVAGENEDDDERGEPEFGDWLEDVDEPADETGEDEVEIAVGAGDNGNRFDPEAVRISEGTTVVWEWTGDGGSHDVVHDPDAEEEQLENGGDSDDVNNDDTEEDDVDEDDDLEPEFETDLTEEEGHTFEHEFDEAGTYLYVCTAHEPDGMRGAIVVAEDEDEDEDESEDENGDQDANGDGDQVDENDDGNQTGDD